MAVDSSTDVAWRMSLDLAAALVAFGAVAWMFRRARRMGPSDLAAAAGLCAGVIAADSVQILVLPSAEGPSKAAVAAALVLYTASAVGAVLLLRAGRRSAVAAAAFALLGGWVLWRLFAWTYAFLVR